MVFIALVLANIILIILYGNLKRQQQLMERLIDDIEVVLMDRQGYKKD